MHQQFFSIYRKSEIIKLYEFFKDANFAYQCIVKLAHAHIDKASVHNTPLPTSAEFIEYINSPLDKIMMSKLDSPPLKLDNSDHIVSLILESNYPTTRVVSAPVKLVSPMQVLHEAPPVVVHHAQIFYSNNVMNEFNQNPRARATTETVEVVHAPSRKRGGTTYST